MTFSGVFTFVNIQPSLSKQGAKRTRLCKRSLNNINSQHSFITLGRVDFWDVHVKSRVTPDATLSHNSCTDDYSMDIKAVLQYKDMDILLVIKLWRAHCVLMVNGLCSVTPRKTPKKTLTP